MTGLSADEFQLKLCENLKHQGFVNDLKSQMRNRLINELIQHSSFKLFENKSKYSSPNSQVVTEKFVNSAIISYLKRYGYEYTLSIFLPECGLNSENIISEKDLLDHLMVKTSSGNSFIIHSSGSVLERLFGKSELSILSSVQKRNDDADSKNIFSRVRKDNVDTLNFNTTLNETDENVDCLLNSEKSRQYSYKERQQAEVDLQVMRFKNTEVENIKLEEKIKCGVELEKFKREIELIYQKKLETLKKKECDVDEKVKHLHANFEKETMMKRQNILLELEKLKHKENALAQKEEWLKTENDMLMKKKIKFESYVQQENENIYDCRKKIEEKVTEMVDLRWQVFEKDVEIKKKEINDIKIDLNAREKKMDNVLKSYEEAKRQLTIKNNEISSLKIDLKAAESNLQNAEKQISEYQNYNKENQQLQLKNVKLK
ncbi:hypothetical protein HELRODRAFT_190060, partial [Helobdella robusta]|uniref:Uncharacterized protein n=1 Tax=Helobdella robusta TaxID=6412 RepID=T1FRM9_HELRO